MPDGRLWLLRDACAAETAWAPPHVGKELRLARLGGANADLGAVRAAAEADAARKVGDHACAARHESLAASYRALSGRRPGFLLRQLPRRGGESVAMSACHVGLTHQRTSGRKSLRVSHRGYGIPDRTIDLAMPVLTDAGE